MPLRASVTYHKASAPLLQNDTQPNHQKWQAFDPVKAEETETLDEVRLRNTGARSIMTATTTASSTSYGNRSIPASPKRFGSKYTSIEDEDAIQTPHTIIAWDDSSEASPGQMSTQSTQSVDKSKSNSRKKNFLYPIKHLFKKRSRLPKDTVQVEQDEVGSQQQAAVEVTTSTFILKDLSEESRSPPRKAPRFSKKKKKTKKEKKQQSDVDTQPKAQQQKAKENATSLTFTVFQSNQEATDGIDVPVLQTNDTNQQPRRDTDKKIQVFEPQVERAAPKATATIMPTVHNLDADKEIDIGPKVGLLEANPKDVHMRAARYRRRAQELILMNEVNPKEDIHEAESDTVQAYKYASEARRLYDLLKEHKEALAQVRKKQSNDPDESWDKIRQRVSMEDDLIAPNMVHYPDGELVKKKLATEIVTIPSAEEEEERPINSVGGSVRERKGSEVLLFPDQFSLTFKPHDEDNASSFFINETLSLLRSISHDELEVAFSVTGATSVTEREARKQYQEEMEELKRIQESDTREAMKNMEDNMNKSFNTITAQVNQANLKLKTTEQAAGGVPISQRVGSEVRITVGDKDVAGQRSKTRATYLAGPSQPEYSDAVSGFYSTGRSLCGKYADDGNEEEAPGIEMAIEGKRTYVADFLPEKEQARDGDNEAVVADNEGTIDSQEDSDAETTTSFQTLDSLDSRHTNDTRDTALFYDDDDDDDDSLLSFDSSNEESGIVGWIRSL